MSRSEEAKKELVRQWLGKARQDLEAAAALLAHDPPFLYPVCFHAQQAAEKYLKAFLTWHQIEFPKTHSIKELLDLAAGANASLADSLREAVVLTPFGVDLRYPGDAPEPNEEEAKQAFAMARQVERVLLDMLN
jgi:HEPN domain-containing protein